MASLTNDNVTHVGTSKNFDLSTFIVRDPYDHIKTFLFATLSSIYQSKQIYIGSYPDATDFASIHVDQPKFCFGRVSSYHSNDFRVLYTINWALPNHSGGPVLSLSDEDGDSVIGMHLESMYHRDDSHRVSNGEQVEDDRSKNGQIVVHLEEINVASFENTTQHAAIDSPDLSRTKQRAKFSEDNVKYKTSMGVFVQIKAISLFYEEALDVPLTKSMTTINTFGLKRNFSSRQKKGR